MSDRKQEWEKEYGWREGAGVRGFRPIRITLGDLLSSPQEVILHKRHGRVDEAVGNAQRERREAYRAFSAAHVADEIRATVALDVPGASFLLDISRIYRKNGNVMRLITLDAVARERRISEVGNVIKEREILVLATGAYLAYCVNGGAVPGALEFVVADPNEGGEGEKTERFPLLSVEKIQAFLFAKLDVLASSFAAEDSELPPCTDEERQCWVYSARRRSAGKCFTICKVRHRCPQRAKLAELDGWSETESLLGEALF